MLEAITKQLYDISREVCNLQSKYAFAESLLGKISEAQATLVNQMAAKPTSLENKMMVLKRLVFLLLMLCLVKLRLMKNGLEKSQL